MISSWPVNVDSPRSLTARLSPLLSSRGNSSGAHLAELPPCPRFPLNHELVHPADARSHAPRPARQLLRALAPPRRRHDLTATPPLPPRDAAGPPPRRLRRTPPPRDADGPPPRSPPGRRVSTATTTRCRASLLSSPVASSAATSTRARVAALRWAKRRRSERRGVRARWIQLHPVGASLPASFRNSLLSTAVGIELHHLPPPAGVTAPEASSSPPPPCSSHLHHFAASSDVAVLLSALALLDSARHLLAAVRQSPTCRSSSLGRCSDGAAVGGNLQGPPAKSCWTWIQSGLGRLVHVVHLKPAFVYNSL